MKHNPGFLALVDAAKARVTEVDVLTVARRQAQGASFVLLDVREDNEWAADRCAGAEHLGRGILERDVETRYPNKDTELVLYCGGGYRSALAADVLQQMGYTRVSSMAGGIARWRAEALPLEKGA